MRTLRRIVAICTFVSFLATVGYPQGNSWHKVRYNGGTFKTNVDPKDWDNTLTITSETVTFRLKDGQQIEFPSKNISALSYGQEAHRRVGTMVALGIIITPWALFGLFHKTRLHFIGIEFKTREGNPSGLLLQGDKDNYRAIMTSLESVSGAPVSVSEKDRDFVPGLANTHTTKEGEASGPANATPATGSVSISSTPDAADITVDGVFRGNTPSSLQLGAGTHTIKVSLSGFKDWDRTIEVTAGSEIKLNAHLEK